ncbi:MAG TPA: hypothetical protein VGK73_40240 [Polyangiaceae bacterium]
MQSELAEAPPRALVSDRKGALSFGVVATVFASLLGIGLALGLVIHSRYVGFERVVAKHVPADATLALRWDIEKVSLFEPTRRFLLPLFDATGANEPGLAPRRDRLSKAAKLEIGRDLREVLVLFGPNPGDWAVAFGGSFPAGDLTRPLLGALEAEGARAAGPGRIVTPQGFLLARADDGVFVLASNAARLEATLPSHAPPEEIQRTGAGSLRVLPERKGLPPGAGELLDGIAPMQVTGQAEWGNPLRVDLTLRFPGDLPPDLGARVRRALGSLLGTDLDRLEQRFGRFEVQPAGNQAARVRVSLDDTALERVADRAARLVATELALRPALE